MNTMQVSIHTDQDLIPQDMPAQRIIEIGLTAPQATANKNRQRLNLALVIDRSGSMSGEPLEYVKQAALHVLNLLQPEDHAAVVAYDDRVTLVAPSQPVTAKNRFEMSREVMSIRTGGSTNLADGWLTGCQEAAASAEPDMLTRTLLLTDGLANAGLTDLEALAVHARQLAVRGVSTSTFGVGYGFNEHLLEAMANQGGGHFYYIETPREIPDLFRREFEEMGAVTLRDVVLTIQLPPQVHTQVLGSWRNDCANGVLTIHVGGLTAERQQELYVKVLTPPSSNLLAEDLVFAVEASGIDESGSPISAAGKVTFRYAPSSMADSEPRRQDVIERYAAVEMADVATEALKLERAGERDEASRLVRSSLAANAPNISPAQAASYQQMADQMEHGMSEDIRKARHYENYMIKRRRDSQ
jgi:Ca-activated chloride channel homolog